MPCVNAHLVKSPSASQNHPMRKSNKPITSAETRVFNALSHSKWLYRTAEGIAKETHLPKAEVEQTLKAHPEKVRISLVRRRDGSILFASKEKVSGLRDAWTAVRAISKVKFEK